MRQNSALYFSTFGFIFTKWWLTLKRFVIRQNTGQMSIKNRRLKIHLLLWSLPILTRYYWLLCRCYNTLILCLILMNWNLIGRLFVLSATLWCCSKRTQGILSVFWEKNYIKPYMNGDHSVFVKRVQFKLHDSYVNPKSFCQSACLWDSTN